MSFRISIPPRRRAALRLISNVRQQLSVALSEEAKSSGKTQADVAREMEVHRSVINRFLSGSRDMLVGNLAEFAWTLDREVTITVGPANSGVKEHDVAAAEAPATTVIVPKDEARKYAYRAVKTEDWGSAQVTPTLNSQATGASEPTGKLMAFQS